MTGREWRRREDAVARFLGMGCLILSALVAGTILLPHGLSVYEALPLAIAFLWVGQRMMRTPSSE